MKKIKKYTLILLIFLFGGFTLPAQTADEGASLGIRLGVNISNYNLKESSLKTAPGFNLGIFSSAALSKCFSLQPEINLNVQNSEVTVNNELSNAKFNVMLSYVELVISGRMNFDKLYVQAGPYISYLANSNISDQSKVNEVVSRKNFYDIDWGLIYSGGIQLKRWDIGLRYNHGLYEIGKPSTEDNNLNIFRNAKTSSLQLYAGYYF